MTRAIAKVAALLLFLLPPVAFAQAAEIVLVWGSDCMEDFEGALVLTRPSGDVEVVKSVTAGRSSDGSFEYSSREKKWKVHSFAPGLYQFYVTDVFADDDFSQWDRYEWPAGDQIQVRLTMGGSTRTFRPTSRPGLVWYAFSMTGEEGEVTSVDTVMPFQRPVFGRLKDAATGKPLTGVEVVLRSVADGKVVYSETADEFYLLHAGTGRFTLELLKDNYIPIQIPVEFIRSEFPIRVDADMSAFLADKQHRLVLSWGAEPKDLDAHVIGPIPSSSQSFHISYRNMRAYGDRHFLDIDDTTGYGPETITLGGLDKGTYAFAVHDYSDLLSARSSRLSYSGATVRLYRERELLKTVTIPAGVKGTVWRALRLDGSTGVVTVLNELYFESNPEKVQ